jgi:hypothetical protein
MWENPQEYIHNDNCLFLGQYQGQEIGIKTERHAITIAGAGAGKGACVIIPNLLRWTNNALVIDPKGEAAEATASKRAELFNQNVNVLDPFMSCDIDKKFRASYNFLADLNEASITIKEDIEAISDGIIKRDNPEASHWDDGAQAIISGLIAFLVLTAPDDKRNLIELRAIMRNVDHFDKVLEEMRNLEGCAGLCQAGASAAFAKEGGYFVSNAEKNTRWLDSEAMKNCLVESTFSLSDLKNKNADVFLVLPANYLGQHGRFLRLFVRGAIEEMARRTPSGKLREKQCLFILDEFFSLGYIDEISKAAGLMRGYGLQLWPILQDLGQLVKLYGREGAETFFGNADLHQFFGNTDQTTLEMVSSRLGVTDVSEIPLPPVTPVSFTPGAHSRGKDGQVTFGEIIDSFQAEGAAKRQAEYQSDMNNYQRFMSTVGKPRFTPDQVAKLIQRKSDVVADGIINILYGAHPLYVAPLPYFREIEPTPEQANYSEEETLFTEVFSWVCVFIFLTILSTAMLTLPYLFIDYGSVGGSNNWQLHFEWNLEDFIWRFQQNFVIFGLAFGALCTFIQYKQQTAGWDSSLEFLKFIFFLGLMGTATWTIGLVIFQFIFSELNIHQLIDQGRNAYYLSIVIFIITYLATDTKYPQSNA